MRRIALSAALLIAWSAVSFAADAPAVRSHPPLRQAPPPSQRPLPKTPVVYVDPLRGDDSHDGSEPAPWQTLKHAVEQLHAGDTLVLRGGVYYENVYLSLQGTPEKPITIRGFPGERAILDGGMPEFFYAPVEAWEPVKDGAADEYRSVVPYPNLRHVLGWFGDSMVGLQTYYHPQDLRAANEVFDWEDWDKIDATDLKPIYLGPGIWNDPATGRIHVRLSHTKLPAPVPNYRGETDPRKLPLVISSFSSLPLHVDGARHVRIQDLTIRGAGYGTIRIDTAEDVQLDGCTVWCGTYGLQVLGTTDLKLMHCGFYGSVAPWTFRSDGSKRDYPGRPHRNLSRMNTHAILEIASGLESSVYATPQNDRWEIGHCEFAEAHDGVYLGAIGVDFHHNLVESLQDDGLYLSPMYLRHKLDKTDPRILVHENVFRGVLTAIAFGGSEPDTRDEVFLYRNVFDLRQQVPTGRPTTRQPQPNYSAGKLMGDHGSPPWPAMNVYHNTIVAGEASRDASMAAHSNSRAKHPRRTFNNIFLHLAQFPGVIPPDADLNAAADGDLFWGTAISPNAADLLKPFLQSEKYVQSKQLYPAGSLSHVTLADPKVVKLAADPAAANDSQLQPGSPAIDAGVDVPADWPDSLRSKDAGRPDVGAIPAGGEMPQVGIAR